MGMVRAPPHIPRAADRQPAKMDRNKRRSGAVASVPAAMPKEGTWKVGQMEARTGGSSAPSDDPGNQASDLVRQALPLGLGQAAGHGRLHQGVHMVTDHVRLDAPQRCDDRVYLVRDIDAIAFRLDHLLNAAHLPFDPTQPRDLLLVIDRDAPVVLFGT